VSITAVSITTVSITDVSITMVSITTVSITAVSITNRKQTLIIVTADHLHTLTINGYPDRGNNILGISDNDNETYETLTYANGPGYTFHRLHNSDSQEIWINLKNASLQRNGTFYRHFSPFIS